ncbi:MAG: esterase/lipase family protein [Verrucomicrobiales bacterium]
MFSSKLYVPLSLWVISLTLVSCVAPLSVDEKRPVRPEPVVVSDSALKRASQTSLSDPYASIGETLDLLRPISARVESGDESAVPEYNFLMARLVEHFMETDVRPWTKSVEVPSKNTKYVLRGSDPGDLGKIRRLFVAEDTMHFKGRYATLDGRRPGLGAPLVAFLSVPAAERHLYKNNVRFRDVTAVIRFDGNYATIDLEDPYRVDTIQYGRQRYHLAAGFGAGAAYGLSKERIDKLGLARLINPGKYDDTAFLAQMQPYDPDRIPVIFVHGLQDTPASFFPMFLKLINDPEIRKRYQFWAFSYPSGYPYPTPAAQLRKELDDMKARYPDHKDIVMIGHSMGGLVTRLMVTDAEDRLWVELFKKSPADTQISGDSRQVLEEALVFNSRDDISRVMFFSAPHRGSNLAVNWVGKIGSKLVKLPATMANVRDSVVNAVKLDRSGLVMDRMPNSIDTLSPTNRFVMALGKIPLSSRIPYHSVMGDRGKDQPKEKTSDGVVAYWSSHLDGAQSERLVPSNHSSHQHPEGIEEARRVLYLHAGVPYQEPTLRGED